MGAVALAVMLILAVILGFPVLGFVQLLITLLIWMFVGNIAGQLVRGEDYGVAGNMALGLLGGIVGTFVLSFLGFGGFAHNFIGGIITGIFGAILFVHLMRWTIDKNFGK